MTFDKSKTIVKTTPTGANSYVPQLRQTFNNTQNYTVPNNVSGVVIAMIGGGGGGGSTSANDSNHGSGGGAGGFGIRAIEVVPGSTIAVTIGAGGTGGNAGARQLGSTGGVTTVAVGNITFSANGGLGGPAGTSSQSDQSGGGGAGSFSISNRTAGTTGAVPETQTNFVFDYFPLTNRFTYLGNNPSYNSIRGVDSIVNAGSGQSGNNVSPSSNNTIADFRNINTRFGSGTNLSLINANPASLSGGGGGASNYLSNAGSGPSINGISKSISEGVGGVAGGGGAVVNANGLDAGKGGDGAGGTGGSGSYAVSNTGAGGGGGLTGAGSSANTTAGGAGGTGGGGGGGGRRDGAGGTGGAGACLIYY
jgi:hypothetical protein